MKYEVLERYWATGEDYHPWGFADGTPMKVRIHPEDNPAKAVLTSMIMAAYSMGGVLGLGSLAATGGPDKISLDDALDRLYYETEDKRTLWDKVKGVPDTRVPAAAEANKIHGRAVKLLPTASSEVESAYDMYVHGFIHEVGSVDELFKRTEQLLPEVQKALEKPKSIWQRISE